MTSIQVRDMTPADEAYVASSSRQDESVTLDETGKKRLRWLKALVSTGLRVKVALLADSHAGVAYVVPIESCPWCATGKDLMALPCMYVHHQPESHGIGHALVSAAEDEARNQGRGGLVIVAHRDDFWGVAPGYFEKGGYQDVGHRGRQVVLWKRFNPGAEPPKPIERRFKFERVKGKVIIDLFHNSLCRPSVIEARRVRELATHFGGKVMLREHCTDDREVLLEHGIPRGILINGREVSWGHAAPDEGIKQEISKEIIRVSLP